MTDASTTFSVKLDSNAQDVGARDAAALKEMRDAILGSTDAIRALGAAQRQLRGSTDEVRAARSSLKAQIEAERDKISASSLALLKQGTTYDQLVSREKAGALARAKADADRVKQQKAHDEEWREAAKQKADDIKKAMAEMREASAQAKAQQSRDLLVFAEYAGIAKDAVVALTRAVIQSAISLAAWVLSSANALRTMGLLREAAAGTAVDALHLGHQVDALADKVSMSREEVNGLYVSMVRAFSGTFVGGAGIVKLTTAVAQANDALEGSGDKLRDIIDRGKNFGRISISPFELQGTGLRRDDVAAALAKNLKIGLADARMALASGRVSVEAGIDAIAAAVETRFGGINIRKLSDFGVFATKLRDKLVGLTSGVKLDALGPPMRDMIALFGEGSVVGNALKGIITDFGNALVGAAVGGAPIFKTFVQELTLLLLELEIKFYQTKIAIKQALGPGAFDFDTLKLAKDLFEGVAVAVLIAADAFSKGMVAASRLLSLIRNVKAALTGGWDAVGKAITQGLTGGLVEGTATAVNAVQMMSTNIKNAFRHALGIQSPSKVFAEYGKHTAKGFEQGVDAGAPGAQRSADRLAPDAPAGAAAGGGPGISVEVHIHVGGGGQSVAAQLSEPSFLAQLVRAIETALQGAGIPTQAAVSP